MSSSLEDVLALFRKWKADSTRVRVAFWSGVGIGQLTGCVLAVEDDGRVAIWGEGTNGDSLVLNLHGCLFKMIDPRAPPAYGGPAVAALYHRMIEIQFPTGDTCHLLSFAPQN